MSSFTETYRLVRGAQKARAGVPLYTLVINRPLGGLVAALVPSWVTPNILTWAGFVLSLVGISGLAFGNGSSVWAVLIPLSLVIGYILDSADGQLSRLRGVGSAQGEWLDHVLDGIRQPLLHLGTLVYFLRSDISIGVALVSVSALLVSSTATYTAGLLFAKLNVAGRARNREVNWIRSSVMLLVDFGVLCWTYVLIRYPALFLAVYSILAVASVLFLIAFFVKSYRELAML